MKLKRVLICLVGLPAAGKSTLCAEILSQPCSFYTTDYICYDEHIKTIDHLEDPLGWSKARQGVNRIIEDLVIEKKRSNQSSMILLDDNFYYRGMRKEIYHIAQRQGCVFGQVVFPISRELSIANNNSRKGSTVTTESIERMFKCIEYPSESWEKHVLTLDGVGALNDGTLQHRLETVAEFIQDLFKYSEEIDPQEITNLKEEERKNTSKDFIQQCDISIRRLISQKMGENIHHQIDVPYKTYGKAKAILLNRLKTECSDFSHRKCSQEFEQIIAHRFEEVMKKLSGTDR